MKKIKNFLTKYNINKDNKIVVACSGGPDSMFLLHTLNKLGFNVICAHVNHNVRSISEEEYKFVKNYCDINNIIFEGMKIEKYEKDNFHNEARTIRYNFFNEVVKKYNAKYLATAHHGDDLIETILMRINRGSSLSGYAGFKNYQQFENNIVIRPLVQYTKDEIKNKVDKNLIPYVVDKSNESNKYTRNRFRHAILPVLKEENKQVHKKYYEFNEELNEVASFINNIAKKKINSIYQNNTLDIKLFNKEDIVIQKEILRIIFNSLYKNKINVINKKHMEEIIELINSIKPQGIISLPNNIIVGKVYDKLIYNYIESDVVNYNIILDKETILPNGHVITMLEKDNSDSSNYTIRLNSKEIVLPLIVRNKKNGDKMIVKNMKHHKKIKEIFIENKIENRKRIKWPIVTDSTNKIIWVPGLKKSNLDVKKTDKYDIIIKYSLKGEKK